MSHAKFQGIFANIHAKKLAVNSYYLEIVHMIRSRNICLTRTSYHTRFNLIHAENEPCLLQHSTCSICDVKIDSFNTSLLGDDCE